MSGADKKKFDAQELMEALSNLDFENIGGWPAPIKAGAAVLVFVAVLALGYFFSITDKYAQQDRFQRIETDLMQQYERKAFTAQNLEQYKKQMVDMEEMFGSLLSQLPRDTEVPGLLEDITHTGLGSGLEIEKIALGQVVEREFYAELPIEMTVRGDFHGFGSLVSGVAALPRIVTLGDFSIKPVGQSTNRLLELVISAKTYRYASAPARAESEATPARRRGR
ncbi:MAG: pilus assembly protein PilP [Gammaproteobacteria bacterium HGW-Gammaproteobacteria-14]|nr:MAG: pilus assembly protein PilP [Gammaproteobacteria bacterium HGW-Gammaproteobacteria-14]